jgi:hypothetical protein
MSSDVEAGRRWAVAIVLAHAAIALVHGAAHRALGIVPSPAAQAFIVLVIGLGPIVALVLMRFAGDDTGGAALAATMAGSLAFGLWNHFAISSPDHVDHVAPGAWGRVFQVTAVLLAVTEGTGTWAGLRVLAGTRARSARVEE